MARLIGANQYRSRLRAIQLVKRPINLEWAEETVRLSRAAVPVRTGTLQRSIRVASATDRKATVTSHYTAIFIDAGTKEHTDVPRHGQALRWESKVGGTVFAKRAHIPRMRARPFRARVAKQALKNKPLDKAVVDAWNKGA